MNRKYWLAIFLLTGLLLRLIISFPTFSGDVTNHMVWGEIGAKHGLKGLYEVDFPKLYKHIAPNYPPFAIFAFTFLFLLKQWIYQLAWFLNLHIPFFPSNFIFILRDFDYYPYLLKLPAIIADIGIAWISFLFAKKIVKKRKSSFPLIILLLVLFNPAYFYNSAYWGQTDSVPLFFLLVSFYLLLYSSKFIRAGLFFILGLLFKQTIVIFIPLFAILLYIKSNIRLFSMTLIASLLLFVISFIPFAYKQNVLFYPFLTYWNKILLVSGVPYTSNHAFNLWFLVTGSRKVFASSHFLSGLSYEQWGYLLVGLIYLLLLMKLYKDKFKIESILYVGFLIPFASFLFLTKMHERHLILTLPFLLLLTYKNKFLLSCFLFISLFNLINMYHSWWSPHFYPLEKVLSQDSVLNFLTILLLGVFSASLINYFKLSFLREKKI